MLRSLLFGFAAAVALGLPGAAAPQVPDDPMLLKKPLHLPGKKEAMAMKLKQSQAILEGIALNNFDKIAEATADLLVVCDFNEFLHAYKGDEYRFQLKTFRRTAEIMAQKAKDKNIDGVALAYQDMTNSCLHCHQALRDKKFDVSSRND